MSDFFRRYVFDNLGLKVVALIVAVLLWWTVGHDAPAEMGMVVPVEFHHMPDNLEISSENVFQVQIRLRGPSRALRELHPDDVHAVIDLEGATPGERTFDLSAKHIHIPRELEVVQIVPSQFRISFDRNATRTVSVRPRVIGTLVSGYGITEVTADPSQITILGPEHRVHNIEAAITDPVDATGVIGKATFTTHAYVPDPLVRLQQPGPIQVTVVTGKISPKGASQL